ncbi:29 kDa ribonucleoprotein B, chloroplastic [Apostasia shenzhenica]|uniref:29 kDa ribonucleoprotein B, chloroplastic n=1 Tax=Apostasia shenzhenica TaxID=1088818 RepID=A0A2I0AV49_9ASPA|nr:29 kDa ribonucleoprotein B, chloroplastic [Apostasia shenzhenica]
MPSSPSLPQPLPIRRYRSPATMAAAAGPAAAAAASCFSATAGPRQALRFFSARAPSMSALSRFAEHPSVAILSPMRTKLPRITAAVAQEEATAAAVQLGEETVAEQEELPPTAEPAAEQAPAEGEAPLQNTKLYFGNLPYHFDSAQLAGVIQKYASPEMVELLYDRDTGRSRGFAFVTMSTVEDCEVVVQKLDGSEYGGRTLRVNFSDKPKAKAPLYPESEFKLFVGNLSWSVTTEALTEVFREYGSLVGARVLYDGETGRSRGYGFVCYSTKEEMDAAMEALNGVELKGRGMRISTALGKKT